MLLQLLKNKGCTYEFNDKNKKKVDVMNKGNKKDGKKDVKKDIQKEESINAEDIDDKKFEKYIQNQNNNIDTRPEKVAIEKHLYKKHFNSGNY